MSRGLILGKFMPLHNGHVWAIEVASKLVDELTVLICTQTDDPINGELRNKWVNDALPANAKPFWFRHHMPQKPEDHPKFWNIWNTDISNYCGKFDKVFGGDPYVVELARQLGATPVPLGRDIVNISATEIREDPRKHWEHIPSQVRSHYQKRVTLLGPESVGKSTLSRSLSRQLHSTYIPEYGRLYDRLLKAGKEDWKHTDFYDLAETHRAMRETTMANGEPLVIEDTDGIQTLAWCNLIMGECLSHGYVKETADLYLLLKPDVPWVDDGTRYGQEHRAGMFLFLEDQLASRGLNYKVIEGDWNNRYKLARDAIYAIY